MSCDQRSSSVATATAPNLRSGGGVATTWQRCCWCDDWLAGAGPSATQAGSQLTGPRCEPHVPPRRTAPACAHPVSQQRDSPAAPMARQLAQVSAGRGVVELGSSPAIGAALCDRLCFPRDAAAADSLHQGLLAQRERSGAVRVHVSEGNLPWWWLLLCTSICVPIQITFGLLVLVLMPADVVRIVGEEDKAKYLGIAVTIASVIQNCQPIMGSISDKTRSRFGRRRPYIFLGQAVSVLALIHLIASAKITL